MAEPTPAPCDMRRTDSYPFAWCRTHDTTFPLGATCPERRTVLRAQATAARARGDWEAERRALDALALDERARGLDPRG